MSREEAAAEIDTGRRRQEIADEAIRETACVDAERLKPRFHEKRKKAKQSRSDRDFFDSVGKKYTQTEAGSIGCNSDWKEKQ